MRLFLGSYPFEGGYLLAICLQGQGETGVYRFPIQYDRTGTAVAFAAAVLDLLRPSFVSENIKECLSHGYFCLAPLTVQLDFDLVGLHASTSFKAS